MYLSTITRHFALVIIDYLLYTLLHHTFDLIGFTQNKVLLYAILHLLSEAF